MMPPPTAMRNFHPHFLQTDDSIYMTIIPHLARNGGAAVAKSMFYHPSPSVMFFVQQKHETVESTYRNCIPDHGGRV
jgi:hypothetical protein